MPSPLLESAHVLSPPPPTPLSSLSALSEVTSPYFSSTTVKHIDCDLLFLFSCHQISGMIHLDSDLFTKSTYIMLQVVD
jgi:hypothetical protein